MEWQLALWYVASTTIHMCPTRLGKWIVEITPRKLDEIFRVVGADGEDCPLPPLPAPRGVTSGGDVDEFIMMSIALACWTAGVNISANVVCSVLFHRITKNGQCALSMLR